MSDSGRSGPADLSKRETSADSDSLGAAAWVAPALVGGLTLLVFLPSLGNGFVSFDDTENFLDNPHYRGLGWSNVRWMFASAHMGHYVPITWLSLGLDYALWGMRPVGYHLTSIVLHAVNAVLFYLLALPLLDRSLDRAPHATRSIAIRLGAAVAALTFSLHPLRVESVAWITERRDLVCGLFTLLSVHAYLRAWRRGQQGSLHPAWYWTAVALFALALLSKAIVVGLPLVLLGLDLYPLRRLPVSADSRRRDAVRLLREKIPFALASTAVGIAMLIVGRRDVLTPLATLGIAERLAISSYGLVFYLWKTVLPWPLSPFYDLQYPVRPLSPGYLLAGVAVLVITAGTVRARRRWPAGLMAWFAYSVLLLPVIGIVHNGMQVAADRYTYLACLGWALLAGAGVAAHWHRSRAGTVAPRTGRLIVALSATVILALGALSTAQIRVWRDSETLWRHVLALSPRSALGHYGLAGALRARGQNREARAELELALDLLPDRFSSASAVFHASLGQLLQQEGDAARAEASYRAALALSGNRNVLALNNLGAIHVSRGEHALALDAFLRALRVAPGQPSACVNARRVAALLGKTPSELESCPPAPDEHPRTR